MLINQAERRCLVPQWDRDGEFNRNIQGRRAAAASLAGDFDSCSALDILTSSLLLFGSCARKRFVTARSLQSLAVLECNSQAAQRSAQDERLLKNSLRSSQVY